MLSLEKTRQTLQSLNLAVLIINGIFAFISLIISGFAIYGLFLLNDPQFKSGLTADQVAQMNTPIALLSSASVFILFILYLLIFILSFRNRKAIQTNTPSLLPYYLGIGEVLFNLLTFVIQGMVPPLITLLIQGGLLLLYLFSSRYARLLVDNSRA